MLFKMKLLSIPLVLSVGIMCICYPGFMSYDSVRMLEEARSFARGGIYPPTPVYILRFFDLTGFGVPLMVFTQNFVILFCIALLLSTLKVRVIWIVILSVILLAMPAVLGCMLVLWKDVTLTSILMLSMILIMSSHIQSGYKLSVSKWLSFFLLALSTLVRFNAISATLVVLAYWIITYYEHTNRTRKIVHFMVSTILIIFLNSIINNYKLPTFEKLEKNNIVYAIMAYDLIGISKWAREVLVPFYSEQSTSHIKADIHQIDLIYSPLGAETIKVNNRLSTSPVQIYPEKYSDKDLIKAWINALINHPRAYIQYRWDMFSEIIGATDHATFEPTHFNRIDENKFGIIFHDRTITTLVLKYIEFSSAVLIGKPWLLMLIGFVSIVFIWKDRIIAPQFKMFAYASFFASLMYISPFFFITGTGEVRYSYPAILLCSNCILIWCFARSKYMAVSDFNNKKSYWYRVFE